MQKSSSLFYFVCAFMLIYGYCNVTTHGATRKEFRSFQQAASYSAKSVFSSNLVKSKNHSPYKKIEIAPSHEIWGRVRQRFHLSAASTPLFKRHLSQFSKSQSYINKLVQNASPYFFYILEEVEKRGMPSEIALLPMIESEFNPHNKSPKGAVGLWQIMPALGRLHHLKQNAWYDGRKDVYESTKVALDHLAYLHKRFNGNWFLALAAYNSGETKVLRAIKQNKSNKKSTDFWSLALPTETKHFVPKLLALAAIIQSPKSHGISLPSIPNKPIFARVSTGKALDIAHAAKLAEVSETQLRKLNPGFHKKSMHPSGPFHLLVPVHQADKFKKVS